MVLAEIDAGTAAVAVALISSVVGPFAAARAAGRKVRSAVGTPNGKGDALTILSRMDDRLLDVEAATKGLQGHMKTTDRHLAVLEAGCPLMNPAKQETDAEDDHP